MKIKEAIKQINVIHSHMSKVELFSGYKPFPVFIYGCSAFALSIFQFFLQSDVSKSLIICEWLLLALVIGIIFGIILIYEFIIKGSEFRKNQFIRIIIQFFPFLISGAIISIIFLLLFNESLDFLPVFWIFIFGLGIISMNPYLPPFSIIAGFFYLICGTVLLILVKYDLSLNPLALGITFGTGHFIASLILLYTSQSRGNKRER